MIIVIINWNNNINIVLRKLIRTNFERSGILFDSYIIVYTNSGTVLLYSYCYSYFDQMY